MGRYANTGEFNVLYPTRRRMATILKRIIRDDILNPTGSTLIDSIRINAKITGGFEILEIQIIAAYYFIYLNNGVPQTSNQYGPNNGSIVSRDFVEKFTYELNSSGITNEIVIPLTDLAAGHWKLIIEWKSDAKEYLYEKSITIH